MRKKHFIVLTIISILISGCTSIFPNTDKDIPRYQYSGADSATLILQSSISTYVSFNLYNGYDYLPVMSEAVKAYTAKRKAYKTSAFFLTVNMSDHEQRAVARDKALAEWERNNPHPDPQFQATLVALKADTQYPKTYMHYLGTINSKKVLHLGQFKNGSYPKTIKVNVKAGETLVIAGGRNNDGKRCNITIPGGPSLVPEKGKTYIVQYEEQKVMQRAKSISMCIIQIYETDVNGKISDKPMPRPLLAAQAFGTLPPYQGVVIK